MYLARVACVNGGLPQHTSALTVKSAVWKRSTSDHIGESKHPLNDTDVAVAGGVESMSRGGYLLPALRGTHE